MYVPLSLLSIACVSSSRGVSLPCPFCVSSLRRDFPSVSLGVEAPNPSLPPRRLIQSPLSHFLGVATVRCGIFRRECGRKR